MADLTTNMKMAIGILLLLGIPINFLRYTNTIDKESFMICAEITTLTVILVMLMLKRSKWGLIGSVVFVILGIMSFSVWNIIDILTGAIEPSPIWLCIEPVSLGLSILFLRFVFKAYRE